MTMGNISKELFELLGNQFSGLTMGDENGEVTLQPKDAVFFEFDYKRGPQNYGPVVVSLNDDAQLKVYFSDNMVNELAGEHQDQWYDLLRGLSKFSTRNLLNYEAKNISKERLDKKDFEHLINKDKSKDDEVMEGKLYGSKQKSYQDLNGAKLIVQHRKTVDEEKMGSRSRNIKAIYIENSEGERFKFVNNYLPGARAMARHVSNGGYPNDPAGSHIVEIMKEMQDLKHFVRKVKSNEYVDEDAQEVIECATDRYYGLKNTLVGLNKQKGYADYFENWEPNEIEVDENDLNDLRAKLTRNEFDDRLTDSLSAVGRAMKLKEKKSGGVYDFGKWERMAKSAGAEIKGDKKEAYAYIDGKEVGSWSQDEKDLDAKYGSDVEDPGYGEINMDQGDRAEGPERDFQVPSDLDLMAGEPSWKGMKFTDNNSLLAAIMRDIGERAKDDEVAIFAADMAQQISSEGTTFGRRKDDEGYKDNKKKAVALAKMAIALAKNESVGESGSGDQPISSMSRADLIDYLGTSEKEVADMSDDELRDAANDKASDYAESKDPMAAYEDAMSVIIGEKKAKPDYLDFDGDGDEDEPMKKALDDKKKKKIGEDVDLSDEAHELVLFGENDYDLYRQRTVPIQKNLTKKFAKGVYDPELAQKLWMYWATDAAKRYANEHSTGDDWNRIFSVAVRKEVAQYMEEYWRDELEAGNAMEGIKEAEDQDKEVADSIRQYAEKSGGIDKADFMKAADMLAKGQKSQAIEFAKGLDTDPRDWLLDKLGESADAVEVEDREDTQENDGAMYQIRYLPYDSDKFMIVKGFTSEEEAEQYAKGENFDELADEWDIEVQEGRMSDIHLEITQMIEDGESDEDIMAKFPGLVSAKQLKDMRAEVMDRPGEYDESINWLKRAAGIGSSARSNFGIREGEQGYQKKLKDEIGKYLESIK